MDRNSPLGQLLLFVGILMVINVIARLLNLPFHISIVGSIILSVLISAMMRPRR